MGRLTYEKSYVLEIDDRTLAHLEAAIGTKLRRGEPFMFTWKVDATEGSGRNSVWIHQNSVLAYKYRTARQQINGSWVSALVATANTPTGLHIVPEPSLTEETASCGKIRTCPVLREEFEPARS